MSVTTSPRTVETLSADDGGAGYGDLDGRPGGPGRSHRWLVLVAVLALAGLAIASVAVFANGKDDEASPSTTVPTTQASTTASTSTTVADVVPEPTDAPVEVEVNGWQLSNEVSELPEYVDTPILYEEGSVEGAIEVGFVNSEIASMRALANPSIEEPELSFWKAGFTLRAARDVQAILVEDGQVIIPGALTRVEIEDITIRSETEADVEYCTLIHDYNVVTENPEDQVESVTTRHAINRMTVGPDGQWQNTELVSEIQIVDGPGPCLDVELTPVG